MIGVHPRARLWLELGGLCADLVVVAAQEARRRLRPRPLRPGAFRTRRPGPKTPHWNACRLLLARELRAYGAKSRLARHLGLPRQRITDFLRGRRRMPDAETLLQILAWVAARQRGEDRSL